VIAGLAYIASQGDEEATEKNKKRIFGAVAGLLVIGLSASMVNFILQGVGGGGAPAVVRAPDSQPASLPNDAPFGGNLPVGLEPDGGGAPPDEPICKPCQTQCWWMGQNIQTQYCNVPFSVSKDGSKCECPSPAVSLDGLTESVCKNLSKNTDPQFLNCNMGKYELTGNVRNGCPSVIKNERTSFAKYRNGECIVEKVAVPVPLPDPKPEPLKTCRCECFSPQRRYQLCKVPWRGSPVFGTPICPDGDRGESNQFIDSLGLFTNDLCEKMKVPCFAPQGKGYRNGGIFHNAEMEGLTHNCRLI
jgi:hypothetical protein